MRILLIILLIVFGVVARFYLWPWWQEMNYRPGGEVHNEERKQSLQGRSIPERHRKIRETWKKHEHPDEDRVAQIVRKILIDAFDGNFDELESLAAKMKKEPPLEKYGVRRMAAFYQGFRNYSDWNRQDAGNWYGKLLDKMDAWKAAYPESPYPWIAKSGLLIDYAWWARGGDFASEVTDAQWRRFGERLEEALETLQQAPESARAELDYYLNSLTIGLGLGFTKEQMETIFKQGQARFPDAVSLYSRMTLFLAPRWYGESPNESHEWLLKATENLPSDTADKVYADAMMDAAWRYEPGELLSQPGADWSRVKRGMAQIQKNAPESTSLPSRMLKIGVIAEDWEFVSQTVAAMGHRFDSWEWNDTYDADFFDLLLVLQTEGVIPAQTPRAQQAD